MLATLAIIVWHLYAVIFDPDAYPINFAWFDGRMSVEHYQHEHPLDTAALLQAAVGKRARTWRSPRKNPSRVPK